MVTAREERRARRLLLLGSVAVRRFRVHYAPFARRLEACRLLQLARRVEDLFLRVRPVAVRGFPAVHDIGRYTRDARAVDLDEASAVVAGRVHLVREAVGRRIERVLPRAHPADLGRRERADTPRRLRGPGLRRRGPCGRNLKQAVALALAAVAARTVIEDLKLHRAWHADSLQARDAKLPVVLRLVAHNKC